MTPARVAASLRYFLARVQLHDAQGLPSRLALTSALVGEGVTYVTRSLAAVIAYDTEASVSSSTSTGAGRPRTSDGARSVAGSPTPSSTACRSTRSSYRRPTRA